MTCGCVLRARPTCLKRKKLSFGYETLTVSNKHKSNYSLTTTTAEIICRRCPASTIQLSPTSIKFHGYELGTSLAAPAPNHRRLPKHHRHPIRGCETFRPLQRITCIPTTEHGCPHALPSLRLTIWCDYCCTVLLKCNYGFTAPE